MSAVAETEIEPVDLRHSIKAVVEGRTLSADEADGVMDAIMSGAATPAQIGALFVALRMRGETVEEIAGFARAMRRHARQVSVKVEGPLIDTCGTGGDGVGSFNISTTAAFVVAGAGVKVAKHGNRAMTSNCGSADLLEALGVKIDLPPEQVAACIEHAGIGFMFAQAYHPGFRHVAPVRRELGVRTLFNVLGPLTNPAGVKRQLIGVGEPAIAEKLAAALGLLGHERVMIVYSVDGLDELSTSARSYVTKYDRIEGIQHETVDPEDVGLERKPLSGIIGGDLKTNTAITRSVLAGEPGAPRDVVLFNAGAALYTAGVVNSFAEGVELARKSLDSGAAAFAVERLVEASNA